MFTYTIATTEGTYVGQLRTLTADGTAEVTHYETAEYLTEEMAAADVNCWKAFHMTETVKVEKDNNDYVIEADDKVYTRSGKSITGADFIKHLNKMIQRAEVSGSKIEYKVHPINNGRPGFHLDIRIGDTPVRKFTILK